MVKIPVPPAARSPAAGPRAATPAPTSTGAITTERDLPAGTRLWVRLAYSASNNPSASPSHFRPARKFLGIRPYQAAGGQVGWPDLGATRPSDAPRRVRCPKRGEDT